MYSGSTEPYGHLLSFLAVLGTLQRGSPQVHSNPVVPVTNLHVLLVGTDQNEKH